ncbi:primary amine oxidase-like protein, partial [Tanacetum coccineum]
MSKATSARTEVTTDIEATTDRAGNSTCNSSVSNINATPTGVTPLINTTAASTVEMNIGGVECERCQNASANKNRGVKVSNEPVNEFPSSYATKLSPTPLTKANLRKHEANVPQDVDYDIWLHAASVHEGVDSVLRDGPWMIRGIPIFLNKWSPSVSLLKEDLSRVPVWVKFHDVPLVAYTSDGLSLIAMKI